MEAQSLQAGTQAAGTEHRVLTSAGTRLEGSSRKTLQARAAFTGAPVSHGFPGAALWSPACSVSQASDGKRGTERGKDALRHGEDVACWAEERGPFGCDQDAAMIGLSCPRAILC